MKKYIKSTYQRKTKEVYVLQGNYGYGWDDILEEDSWLDAKRSLQEYRENESEYPHRVITRRVKISDNITSSVHDDDLFIVCEHCLAAIESREGHQATTKDIPESRLYEVDEYNEYSGETYPEVVGICDWCEEEYPEDELVRII